MKPRGYKMIDEISENTWIISDTHFDHDNILKYEPTRLRDMQAKGLDDQNEWLIDNWNSVVGEDDLVLHLGDFTFKSPDYIERLNGRIILLIGNHDVKKIGFFRKYQNHFPEKFFLVESVGEVTEPKFLSGIIKQIGDKKVFFNHYPVVSVDPYIKGKAKEMRDEMRALFHAQNCDLCIHGHVHSNDEKNDKKREINVSLEKTGFKPVRLGEFL